MRAFLGVIWLGLVVLHGCDRPPVAVSAPPETGADISPVSVAGNRENGDNGENGCALGIGQAAQDACPADAAPVEATVKETTMTDTNVLGGPLAPCCFAPRTGYYRDGLCRTGPTDTGRHVVCAQVTAEFLEFTRGRGNDLSSPVPDFDFPGLKPGDRWCLCVLRWREALEAGVAPPVVLESSHAGALRHVTREQLDAHALK